MDDTPGFAHESERQFATLLDFYGLDWQYEPRTFVLAADDEGNPTCAMTPDFYLRDFDMYIELTTMRQSLVTKKNRKIRLLRERFADIEIRILYAADIERLLARHGLGVHAAA